MPFGSWWMKQNTHLLAQVAISAGRGASSSSPSARPRRVIRTVSGRPSRSSERSSVSSPAWKWKSITSRSGAPLIARMRSPGRRPARAAAVRGVTAATTTPSAAVAVRRGHGQSRPPTEVVGASSCLSPITMYCSPEVTVKPAVTQARSLVTNGGTSWK